jgi:hypothetical protein
MDKERSLKQTRLLVLRLERLSADSIWAHRASGLRGSLLQILEKYEKDSAFIDPEELNRLLNAGYYILDQAVKNPREKAIT